MRKEAGVSTNHRFLRQESVSTEVGDSISKRKKVYYTDELACRARPAFKITCSLERISQRGNIPNNKTLLLNALAKPNE